MDISQKTGMSCPKCCGFIPLTLEQLLKDLEFICPHCGFRMSIERKTFDQPASGKRRDKKTC